VAGDVVAALQPVAARKRLDLDLVVRQDDLLGGDPSRLRQVLMNLVGNAVKFTEQGGVRVDVDVTPGAEGRLLRVSVQDTGAGMAAEEVSRVFTPFVQGEQGERSGGTGLGLALSRQLVELMGGRLDVVSAPGRGSTFTVEVVLQPASPAPASGAPAGVRAAPAEEPPAREPSRTRVLVADDNEVNLMVAEALLAAEGVDVVTVTDGEQAVQAVCGGAFDLVLLDVQMPRMSGLEAALAIRALPDGAGRTRLVTLTAGTADDDRAACRSAGMEHVLVKPVTRAQLRAVLAEDRVAEPSPSGR
jgi:CheY-like chemotaxis protein/anti-sigma regulatory factor (Ser/Thr protein kinase)